MHHADAIAAHLAEWGDPIVDAAIFGTSDPVAIAARIDTFCRAHLGASVRDVRFVFTSVGSVHGLSLDDGRSIVVKAHADRTREPTMRTLLDAATRLAARGLPLPACIVPPAPIAHGFAWIEPLLDGVALRAEVTGATERLARLVVDLGRATDALADLDLPRMLFFTEPDRLWPTPHSPLFDFEATARGAEWIDVIARPARERTLRSTSPLVVGHHDVRVEHVRFDANPPTRITALFDTDSLCRERETHLVGLAAMMFPADFHERRVQAPTVAQTREFVDACEAARGARFTNDEHEEIDAMITYAIAYAVRCGHALRERDESGYPELLHEIGEQRCGRIRRHD